MHFSDSVTPAPSTASTTSESTADLVKSTEISSSKENKANKENVEESKPQSEITGESVEAAEKVSVRYCYYKRCFNEY